MWIIDNLYNVYIMDYEVEKGMINDYRDATGKSLEECKTAWVWVLHHYLVRRVALFFLL